MVQQKIISPDIFSKNKDQKIIIQGPCGDLEALSSWSEPLPGTLKRVALICHPHPLYQGSMYNKVVSTCAKAYAELGIPSLRFNYRGVGESAGSYGDIDGEVADAMAAIHWLQQVLPKHQLCLIGFSFGSYIAAYCASKLPCHHLISIAPPVKNMPFSELSHIACPWLVIQGDHDEVVEAADVQAWHEAHPNTGHRVLEMLPGVSHFFHGQLLGLRQLIVSWLGNITT